MCSACGQLSHTAMQLMLLFSFIYKIPLKLRIAKMRLGPESGTKSVVIPCYSRTIPSLLQNKGLAQGSPNLSDRDPQKGLGKNKHSGTLI